MKALVIGCGGMLGQAVYDVFTSAGHTVIAADVVTNHIWCDYADIRDYHLMESYVSTLRPDVLVNLAAETDLEKSEKEPQRVLQVNACPNLAALATEYDLPYVYISTAGIFDGKQARPYTEFDQPIPLSVYGKGKFYGELIAEAVPKHIVLRPGWMMGGGPSKDKKFINKIYKQIVDGSKYIYAVDDKAGTPTYTVDLAKTMLNLIDNEQYGLFNCTCKGETNRFEIAFEFVRLLGVGHKVAVVPCASERFAKEYFAPRPPHELLDCSRLHSLPSNAMRDWRESLAEYSTEFPVPNA